MFYIIYYMLQFSQVDYIRSEGIVLMISSTYDCWHDVCNYRFHHETLQSVSEQSLNLLLDSQV